jgi:lysophospholipase L1-like esterase
MKNRIMYLKITVFTISFTLLILIILELSIRLFFPSINPQYTDRRIIKINAYEDSNGLQPGSTGRSHGALVSVDPFGLRSSGNKIHLSKKGWLYLGDSATMGIGVEQDSIFSSIVSAQSSDYTILNAGLIGYSSHDYINVVNHFIKQKIDSIKIERVTLFYCLNDVYSKYKDRPLPDNRIRNALRFILDFMNRYFRTYLFLKHHILDRSKSYFLYDLQLYDPAGPEFTASVRDLITVYEKCKELNLEFDLVLLPYEYQLRNYSEKWVLKPQELMQTILHQKNINILDCSEFLAHYPGKPGELYLPGDGIHFSNSGHRLMADFIITVLQDKKSSPVIMNRK